MKPIECGSCDYLPRTMGNIEGVQLVCGKIKKEITWFESHHPFSDDFQPEWCPRVYRNEDDMNFLILNIWQADDFVAEKIPTLKTPYGLISITDPGFKINLRKDKNRYNILRLSFHDLDAEIEGYKIFNKEDAKSILKFYVDCYNNSVETIIVHCHAGISRSPAVAIALCEISNQNSKELIKKYPHYNHLIYKTIKYTSWDDKTKDKFLTRI